ncbi:hypothetical protein [Sandaracinus amylolyticus]|uniref:hypothetical protein n=1 Tax=Sandaracinus amylolyticus TaxID=927083 RepID=UPI001F27B43C|nr:hypothetical protein [Sandaracinus amylolyticus]
MLLAEGACSGPEPVPNLRPSDAPDFVIVAASGHCFGISCPEYNREYLAADGTVQAIIDLIEARGRSAGYAAFSDSLHDWENTSTGEVLAYGWLSMLAFLDFVRTEWIADFDNPTRVIVLGHSHGTVWAHLALMVLELEGAPVPVDVLVDLDGVSIGWEDDLETGFVGDTWASELIAYTERTGTSWPFEVWDAADSFFVPGVSELQDVEEIVPNSVLANLEVWSSDGIGSIGLRDAQPNWRRDGTMTNVFREQSVENHGDTAQPWSDAMRWVVDSIDAAYEW